MTHPLRRRLAEAAILATLMAGLAVLGAYALHQTRLSDMRGMPMGLAGTPTALANQYVRRGIPFVEHEPDGLTLVCVANRAAMTLPPMAMAALPTPTPGAVPFNYAYGPGGYGGASGYSP